jgi:O-methyltransferase
MAGLATPMALRVAVTLGLPDRLLGEGAGAPELAGELNVSPVALDLLLSHLTTLGVLEPTSTGYTTTEYGANCCADAGNGFTNILLQLNSAAGQAELAFVELAHSIATGQAAYPRRYGQDFWADLAEHPHLRESFDQQMPLRFQHRSSLDTFSAHELDDRTEVTAGSFFDPLPAGADAYVLFDILHNWDDEHAHSILARCVEAAQPTGRVLVIEAVAGQRTNSEMDLAMLVIYGGRERRIDEFHTLAAAHGLILDTVTTLTDQRRLLEFQLDANR